MTSVLWGAPGSRAERHDQALSQDALASARLRSLIDERLAQLVAPAPSKATRIEAAMRYALLAPGKRVRPLIALLAAVQHGGVPEDALDAACAVEMVHCASLILDDLPCMDDAALRRGRPATHREFGEDAAMLAAIALLNRAYGVIAEDARIAPARRPALVACLSEAVGLQGLVGGQEADLRERAGYAERADVEELNRRKTGALFAAAAELGARAAGVSNEAALAMGRAGERLGVAFQTMDDVLDKTALSAETGKDCNKDAAKPSIVSLEGAEAARAAAQRDVEAAIAAVAACGGYSAPLQDFMGAMFQPVLT